MGQYLVPEWDKKASISSPRILDHSVVQNDGIETSGSVQNISLEEALDWLEPAIGSQFIGCWKMTGNPIREFTMTSESHRDADKDSLEAGK